MHKTFPAKIKAAGSADGLADGQFRALVSVFGNKDSYGDVVKPGAFADTLAEWKASGESIPVYWSHRMDDPDMNIGWVVEAEETEAGLEVLAQLDTSTDGPSKAKTVHRLLTREGGVRQFSFAYDVLDGGQVEEDGDSFYELRKVQLYEVGPTPIGANSETELLAVKAAVHATNTIAADLKAGRLLSPKNQASLHDALATLKISAGQITSVLTAVAVSDPGEEGSTPVDAREPGPTKTEDPLLAGKAEESTRSTSATWATELDLIELEGQSWI